jgi:hypothetical protein
MSFRPIPYLAAVALLSVASFAAAQFPRSTGEIVAPAPKPTTKKHKPSAKKIQEPPPAPQPPPPPPTLAQMPPVAPKVSFAGGQLTIEAPNSRFSDVLAAVHRATGANFDGPQSDERIAVHLGPGTPRDVITALLHGSRYDYVIVGAEDDPSRVQRVLLMRPGGTQPPGAVLTQGAPRPNVVPAPNPNSVDDTDENTNTEEVPEPSVVEPPPENPGNVNTNEIQNNQENNQENQQPKTPEQLLQELQQLQQQQQQQMQQNNQNPNTQRPPE